ncbi:triose-phosphate isomerase [Helicobacter cappadocius]|uniref:Triosephosphate isomerase n=1 Tax=Helicobacter cappadocius TaxID=3063998 RepID=A0AA90PPL2_9HELI|nr:MULTISPECIES: triose-phosphate isomerase [unclassified Helicobacter]MDO7252464.1 triose-phosphate isomerase [Helicobacter sp. faydin-H75]MDP2538331.1 triose-phosphate isomerase [Helicobacter sp. faydin-H76]
MTKIVAANFKTNHTKKTTKSYLESLEKKLLASDKIYIFPTPIALCENNFKHLKVGTQNAYPILNGAFTGEVGLESLKELDIKTILIGHSERRNILGESQKFCAEKFDFFAKEDFEIIYCVGEDISIREKGVENVKKFIKTQFENIPVQYPKLIIAYEPIWAIGSGMSASAEQIQQTHSFIKEISPAPVLYGGSVNIKNIAEILNIQEVDGVLVGSASLNIDSFYKIIQEARNK